MSATTILILTTLVVGLALAVALLTGSLALFVSGAGKDGKEGEEGLIAALRLLDRQWQIERLVYRHHRAFGSAVLLAGAFCAWQLSETDLITWIDRSAPASVLVWILLLGQVFNLVVGLIILLRPSLLKPVEAVSNRWHRLAAGDREPGRVRLTAVVLFLIGLLVFLGTLTLISEQISGVGA